MKTKHDEKAPPKEEPAKTAGTAVGAPANTAVGNVINYENDAGMGQEGADKDSYAIPFILALQPLSPVVVEKSVAGAEAGMLMNSVTNALFKKLYLIPVAYSRRWIRWGAREAGGGFKGEFTTPQAMEIRGKGLVKELEGRLYYPEADGSINPKKSDRLADTRSHFVLAMDAPDSDIAFPAVLALTSTGIKVSKNWMSRIEGIKLRRGGKPDGELFTPPSFSHIYELTTTLEKNDKGTWFQPLIVPTLGADGKALQVSRAALYEQAKSFNAQVTSGSVTVAHDTVNKGGGEGERGGNDGAF